MKYIFSFIASTRTMAILLFLFAFSIALATFIESKAGTETAQHLIYHAKWFELLFILGILNIIAVTIKRKLYKREKLTILVFHLAFVIIIIGAALTRYLGEEGIMPIREGQNTSRWYSSQNYIFIRLTEKHNTKIFSYPVLFSSLSGNRFKHSYQFNGHKVNITLKKYMPNAEKVLESDPEGLPYMQLLTAENNKMTNIFLTLGDSILLGNTPFIFNNLDSRITKNKIQVFDSTGGSLCFMAPFDVIKTEMSNRTSDTLKAGFIHSLTPNMLYSFNGIPILLSRYLFKGKVEAKPSDKGEMQNSAVMVLDVQCDNISKPLTIWEQKEITSMPVGMDFNGLQVMINYGAKAESLPFSLSLNDFILKRYPGSESPSWFESDVQLIDTKRNFNEKYRIYMNHILKYKGYKFYQASYDADEKGTMLSLNCDWLGTLVTYCGYILLALGMVMSLFNKNSRFRTLLANPSTKSKNSMIILVGLMVAFTSSNSFASGGTNSDNVNFPIIDKKHAHEFGRLLIQANGGRVEPINTLSSEVLRKISRKNSYEGQNPDQVMLGMLVNPGIWQHEAIIRVSNSKIQEILGLKSSYASFIDFFSSDGSSTYLLQPFVEDAYRKEPGNRTKLDNEIIRADEKLNICYLIFTQDFLKVFPDPGDSAQKWYSPVTAHGIFNSDDSVFVNHIFTYYFEEISKSLQNGNWNSPEEITDAIGKFQLRYGASIIPSPLRIKTEIFYNQSNILSRLINIYLIIGLLLLLMQFVNIFISKFSIRFFSKAATILVSLAFLLHTSGLALRWYVSGHAPLSNGFEALSFVAWATILAGLVFSYKSSITISTTAILSALILQIAHLSWMDPQITNLVPVLKSYWLVIHVAVITASYGFLGMATLLAVINLFLMSAETNKNLEQFENQINLLTQIIQLTLIIGLYLLTIGAFLGGVWANESWGRYWGWDPKETWALVTIIVYAFILHMRIVPGLKGRLLFNSLALIGFSSVIMTYFGVNYYLTGLHSYASGYAVPVPPGILYTLIGVIILVLLATLKQFHLKKALISPDNFE